MENINNAKLLNKSLRIKNDSLETENIELKERIRVLKAEIKDLNYDIGYWECQNNALTKHNKFLQSLNSDLHDAFDRITKKLIEVNLENKA